MIKAVVFDCFGVLTTDGWRETMESFDPGLRPKVRDIHHAYDRGFITYDEFKDQVVELTGTDGVVLDKIFLFTDQSKNLPLLERISKLHGTYKIGLLSNVASNWIRESFLSKAEQDLFDEMILSYEVGMTKPDPRIFQLACERLVVDPEQTVFVDDIEAYTAAAAEQGLRTITYKNFVQFEAELNALLTDTDH